MGRGRSLWVDPEGYTVSPFLAPPLARQILSLLEHVPSPKPKTFPLSYTARLFYFETGSH